MKVCQSKTSACSAVVLNTKKLTDISTYGQKIGKPS